jgi:hypothetical protein
MFSSEVVKNSASSRLSGTGLRNLVQVRKIESDKVLKRAIDGCYSSEKSQRKTKVFPNLNLYSDRNRYNYFGTYAVTLNVLMGSRRCLKLVGDRQRRFLFSSCTNVCSSLV